MAYKDPEQQKAYLKDWYQRNKGSVRIRTKVNKTGYKKRNREFLWKIKTNSPCTDCGKKFHPVAMDFDHLQNKDESVSCLANNGACIETLKKEIAKCELVCSNCHRVRTYNRYHGNVVE